MQRKEIFLRKSFFYYFLPKINQSTENENCKILRGHPYFLQTKNEPEKDSIEKENYLGRECGSEEKL